MFKIFELLFGGCYHIWEETHRVDIVDKDNTNIGEAVYCKCTKCGKPVKFKLI